VEREEVHHHTNGEGKYQEAFVGEERKGKKGQAPRERRWVEATYFNVILDQVGGHEQKTESESRSGRASNGRASGESGKSIHSNQFTVRELPSMG
jgi:hypothetical protein